MDPKHQGPIGVMDSGLGGLSIWKGLVTLLPGESILYVGDHAHIPYSGKDTGIIRERVCAILNFFAAAGCKLVVIACNTATVAGIEEYRKLQKNFPIIGVVPVIKTAAEVSKRRRFAVLSTEYTAQSQYQQDLIVKFASDCAVYNIGCPNLVGAVERGETGTPTIRRELDDILGPLIAEGIDVLALGCTHYFFLRPLITEIVGREVSVLDSSGAVARHASRILDTNRIASRGGVPSYRFVTTGDASAVSPIASTLLGIVADFEAVTI